MINLGLLYQDAGDLDRAVVWFDRAEGEGVAEASESLMALNTKILNDADLGAISFEAFGWPLVNNRDKFRQWRGDGATLAVRFMDAAPDFETWDADEIREEIMDTLELIQSPTFRLEDLSVLDGTEEFLPTEMPQQMTLLEFDCFEIPPGKIVMAMIRHRIHDVVHYATSITVLFDRCFWVIQLELEEDELVGEREGAVVRHLLDQRSTLDDSDRNLDPYDRRWDGLIPIENDPLTRMRLLAAQLRGSILFGDRIADLEPFEPEEN
jgi:hypothetical protein